MAAQGLHVQKLSQERKNWEKKERERDIYTVNGKKKFPAQKTLMYQN